MTDSQEIALTPATPSDSELLSNLLELYIHDLSAAFPNVELGSNGRFGYPELPRYWSEPDRRFAFLIRRDGRIAGFVLAKRGSPAVDDPEVLDVAEFFVLRRYRCSGVGRRAAVLLWNSLPGKWTVRVSEGNADGLRFWRDVIAEFTNGAAMEFTRPGNPNAWRVFSFSAATWPSPRGEDHAFHAMTCDLRAPITDAEWTAYHEIRRRVLFDLRGRGAAYDPNHPDDSRPGHYPLVLFHDGEPVGVIRVDVDADSAVFRRVAVRDDVQRRGHGRHLLAGAERFARSVGCRRVVSHVDPDAVGFYERCGFRIATAVKQNTTTVFMTKPLDETS